MLDELLVATGVAELAERGVSEAWANALITLGGAHGTPFLDGDVRAAARASLAASLPAPAPLPTTGAVVALVGAGGAGKTRAAAALAASYGLHSTLPVTVVALGSPDQGTEITELLRDHGNVHVTAAADAGRALNAVTHGRADGFVVIDTTAASPRDTAGITALARELEALAPDAVLIAMPATLSARAGASVIDSLAALTPTGMVITHADETDNVGVAVELSRDTGIPVAYVHDGLELDRAMSVADPPKLAKWLLP
jgi:flagellar biosynthesis protein FlhF